MSNIAHHHTLGAGAHRRTPGRRHWPRRVAVGTLSISSLLVALSGAAYHSFVNLPM